MKSEIDVLILFADLDNEPSAGESGWISQFKRFLELMLEQVLGEKPNVLLKSEYDNITAPRLTNVATLVPILSKNFIQSGLCLEHIEAFYKIASDENGNISRVFKVFKNQLSVAEQPDLIRELIGYDMYQLDPESGEIREYTDYFSTEAERQYWMKMVDLAYDIYDTLMQMKGETTIEIKPEPKRKTIYVAETGHDLSVQRNIIRRELQRHGYSILPNHTLHGNARELEKEIKADLGKSDLSIHLIGAAYGEIPEGTDRSLVDIQNSLAAEKSQHARESNGNFTRLIWISPALGNIGEKQQSFIDKLKRDVESQEGAEILQTPLEDFKNIMREELLETPAQRIEPNKSGQRIYLVHDRIDSSDIPPIAKAIQDSGFEVITPSFDGELLEVRKKHIENLKSFDAAIIYRGKVNEQWVRMKVLDLMKAPGFGRQKPIIGKAIITAPGKGVDKENFKEQDVRILDGDAHDLIDSLKIYLQEFKS